ncbi:MAG: cytidylyltransferase domain-containing protein, partial [Thermoguttaceae bacterium]
MNTIIVIPARYNSKRFPGKPLASLEGKAILERVWEIASFAASRIPNCGAVVATETPSEDCPSEKIISFCESHGINVVTTSDACRSGSDRVWEVVSKMAEKPN